MKPFERQLYTHYRILKPSNLVGEDIKSIRRFNFLSKKFISTKKVSYYKEAINVIRVIYNQFKVDNEFTQLLEYKLIEPEYQPLFREICDEIEG